MGLAELMPAIAEMTWQHLVMITVGLILIYLAIAKNYEPTLLLPMGFGAILVNIPLSSAITQIDPGTGKAVEGVLNIFFDAGIATEVFPLLIFVAIGAMIDFSPLFRNPSLLLFGAAAQFGIFMTMVFAALLGYDIREAASIGIIGAADLPHLHRGGISLRTAHAGCHLGGRLLLHGTGTDYPTARDQVAHHEERALDTDEQR